MLHCAAVINTEPYEVFCNSISEESFNQSDIDKKRDDLDDIFAELNSKALAFEELLKLK